MTIKAILTPPPQKKAYILPCLLMSASVNIFLPVCAAEIATACCYEQHDELWREVDLVNMADLSQLTWATHQQITTEHHYSAVTLSTGGKCVGKLDKHISIISAFCKYCCHCAAFAGRVLWWRPWCRFSSVKRHRIFLGKKRHRSGNTNCAFVCFVLYFCDNSRLQ